jgi:hypothetical protein
MQWSHPQQYQHVRHGHTVSAAAESELGALFLNADRILNNP